MLYAIVGDTSKLGNNGLLAAPKGALLAVPDQLAIEVVLTFVFVLAILGVTSKESNGCVAGLVIGGALVLVHLLGIPFTGTSVNPARTFGPAIFAGTLSTYWVSCLGPLAGGVLAALVWKFLGEEELIQKSFFNNAKSAVQILHEPRFSFSESSGRTNQQLCLRKGKQILRMCFRTDPLFHRTFRKNQGHPIVNETKSLSPRLPRQDDKAGNPFLHPVQTAEPGKTGAGFQTEFGPGFFFFRRGLRDAPIQSSRKQGSHTGGKPRIPGTWGGQPLFHTGR